MKRGVGHISKNLTTSMHLYHYTLLVLFCSLQKIYNIYQAITEQNIHTYIMHEIFTFHFIHRFIRNEYTLFTLSITVTLLAFFFGGTDNNCLALKPFKMPDLACLSILINICLTVARIRII